MARRSILVLLMLLAVLLIGTHVTLADIPAFSGAEGAGSTATGGRGQEVYHVTNLNEAGPGSFVDALSQSNRLIVFDVSGVITLNTPDSASGRNDHFLRVGKSNLTIAGQTAPGNGIVIVGTGMKFTGDNVVMRNISTRPGIMWNGQTRTMDGLWLQTQNSIFDHISVAWASDEGISGSDAVANTTVQYSIAAEGLMDHSYGAIMGPDTANTVLSYHHNLFTNNRSRNPRLGNEVGAVNVADFRNNVLYNWGGNAGYSGNNQEGDGNFVGNYYVAGPNTNSGDRSEAFSGGSLLTNIYQSGNKIDPDLDGVFDGTDTGWSMFNRTYTKEDNPLAAPNVTTQTADDALNTVLHHSGSQWWSRTSTDTRVVNDVRSAGTAGDLIYDPSEVGGWPTEAEIHRPADWDIDGDGMPGYWELEHGLDPEVANNNADFDNDGYTDVEEYINEIAAWPAPRPIVFTGATNGRYAQITNWDIPFQPSRFDTAIINTGVVEIDAVGQHAGNLILGANSDDNPTFNITSGWIKVEQAAYGLSDGRTVIGDHAEATATLNLSGGLLRTETLNKNSASSFNFTGGVLSAGTVGFDLVNNGGTIAPGASVGVTQVLADLELLSGVLEIELASPTEADLVDVEGVFHLGGDLSVSLLDGFDPESGSWVIATASSFTGNFESVTPGFAVSRQGGELMLSVVAGLPGDYNDDGIVNLADYTVWRDNLGGSFDLNGNGVETGESAGVVDAADYNYWRSHYGSSLASLANSEANVVPEPASLLLLLTPIVAIYLRRRVLSGE